MQKTLNTKENTIEEILGKILFNRSVLFCLVIVLGLSPKPIAGTNNAYDNKKDIHITVGAIHQTKGPLKEISGFMHKAVPGK